jgi:thiosulfate/3-mercaptopyruvate sulfurtransferase
MSLATYATPPILGRITTIGTLEVLAMRTTLLALLTAATLLAGPAPAADDPRASLLVSVDWLANHLHDDDLVLLHVGDKKEYDAGHIPGARYVALRDISVSDHDGTGNGLMLEMPAADDLRQRLEALGVSNRSRVIVYYGNDWVSPTTRVLFTLDYAGLGERAAILDGGQPAWQRAGRPVEATVPPPRQGKLDPLSLRPLVVDAPFVLAHREAAGFAVVDGRDASLYDGVETGGDDQHPHKTGHIAGAHSVPFTELTGDDLMVRPAKDLEALFTKAGVKPGDTVVGYCHIGQQATAMLFAARLLGHKVLLYDGSFEDWSRHADYPVENPAAQKGPAKDKS